MTTLLHIKSSIFGDNGQSSQLANRFVQAWQARHPDGRVIERNLSEQPIPHLDAERVTAMMTAPEQRSAAQQAVVAVSDALIEEIRTADLIVLGLPMYNFGVPSQVKAYFDHLARAGVTFKYTENGPVGLLPNVPVKVFAARGGIYHASGQDFQAPFVQQFLRFIGLNDVQFIYAEGLNMGDQPKQTALAQAHEQILQAVQQDAA
jgi:FMN-dependent NADH-azoreductase